MNTLLEREWGLAEQALATPEDEMFSEDELERIGLLTDPLASYREPPNIDMLAFRKDVRMEIGKRDDWTCSCGKSYQDGWMVEASHINHARDKNYNNPKNGLIECRECHLERHIMMYKSNPNQWSENAVRLLAINWVQKGLRIYKETTFRTKRQDKRELRRLFAEYELDLEAFIK